ncbi:FAD-dependent oxidoreductase [Candidatus Latescibacterota bacterium]
MRSGLVWGVMLLLFGSSCGKGEIEVIRAVDRQNMKMVVLSGKRTELVNFYDADFVIVGGGLSGIAATLAACSSGRGTILVEETDSIASCFASTDTSEYFDNRFVETTGSSKRYIAFREKIKQWYEERSEKQPITFQPYFQPFDDFGTGNFCFDNEAAIDVIYDMIEQHIDRDRLTILNRHKIVESIEYGGRLASLNVVDLDNKVVNQVTGWMFIDASETGELLSLCDVEYTAGRESRDDTGEAHALDTATHLSAKEYYYVEQDINKAPDNYEAGLFDEMPSNAAAGTVTVETGSRRLNAYSRITEQDISAEYQTGPRARFFEDSVGIGYSLITLFGIDGDGGGEPVIVPVKPFQIPYSALISPSYTNLIAGGRASGMTFVASTAYNAPSVEWALGESAGEIAGFCAGYNLNVHDLMNSAEDFRKFRERLVKDKGIPVYWYDDVSIDDPKFVEAQLKPFNEPGYYKSARTLHYHGN